MEINFSTQTRLFLGLYEIELNRYLRQLCTRGSKSFDVGGQFGYDALVIAKLSGGPVLSFECDPAMCGELRENVRSNVRFRRQIQVMEAFVTSESDPSSNRVTLDDVAFCETGFVPDFIKMDIEGSELDALLGARRLLGEHHPSLLVETHSQELERDCLDLVHSFGYGTVVVSTRRWLPDYRPSEHNRWFIATHGATPFVSRRRRSAARLTDFETDVPPRL